MKKASLALAEERALFAHTSLFEKVVPTSVGRTANYGEIISVEGTAGPVTIEAPALALTSPKDTFHFAVVDADGGAATHTITIDGNGKNISGAATATITVARGGAILFYSTLLGEWVIFETGSSTAAATPARAWADNAGGVGLTANTSIIGAHVTITPATTGKLRVTMTGVVNNAGEVGSDSTVILSVSHGVAATPPDYQQSPTGPITVPAGEGIPFALTVDLDIAVPETFPVGTPVQINAVFHAGNNGLALDAHGVQLSVQEVA